MELRPWERKLSESTTFILTPYHQLGVAKAPESPSKYIFAVKSHDDEQQHLVGGCARAELRIERRIVWD